MPGIALGGHKVLACWESGVAKWCKGRRPCPLLHKYMPSKPPPCFVTSSYLCPRLQVCHEQNTHQRSLSDIQQLAERWEPTPVLYTHVDAASLLRPATAAADAPGEQ